MEEPGITEYQCTDNELEVTDDMKASFDKDGIILVRNLLNQEELEKVKKALLGDNSLTKSAWELDDGDGKAIRMVLWRSRGNDISAMVARSEKVAGTCEELLRGEVYHFNSKMVLKNPRSGGKHLWHQDYGYWYQNGCLRPDMITVFIALDECAKENGCLQILKGSQKCGRIGHGLEAGQTQADLERVEHCSKHFQHLHCEMNPGDAIFFHCNLLHTSSQNLSDKRRYALLCCYNRVDNDPVVQNDFTSYTSPLKKVPNSAILDCDCYTFDDVDVMEPETDKFIKATRVETESF